MKIKKYNYNQTSCMSLDWSKKIKVRKGSVILKLRNKGSLIGCLYIYNNWIYNFVINPKYRFKGYGRKLLSFAEKEIFKKYKEVKLIPQDNDESLRYFYSKLGYSGFNLNDPNYEEEDKAWWVMTKRK